MRIFIALHTPMMDDPSNVIAVGTDRETVKAKLIATLLADTLPDGYGSTADLDEWEMDDKGGRKIDSEFFSADEVRRQHATEMDQPSMPVTMGHGKE